MSTRHSFKDFLGKNVLILGGLGAGKTRLTARLLEEAVQLGYVEDITLVDMAPATLEAKGRKIGGRISELTGVSRIRYLAPYWVETPRLKAKSADELLRLVRLNRERIEPLIEEFLDEPSTILIINDVSIYLQSGSADLVLSAMKAAKTFIANGYLGEFFAFNHGTGVSKKERELMDLLANHVDRVIWL